jgi:hypothetical protein
MSIQIKQESSAPKERTLMDGTYPARISVIADLGTQMEVPYQETVAVEQKRLAICFEFPTETIEIDGAQLPQWLTKEYTKSFGEKANLMKLIKALKPSATALDELAGMECLVTVGSTATGNAKVTTVVGMMKGMEVAALSKPAVVFDFSEPTTEALAGIPQHLQEKVKRAVDYSGFAGDTPLAPPVGSSAAPTDNPFPDA